MKTLSKTIALGLVVSAWLALAAPALAFDNYPYGANASVYLTGRGRAHGVGLCMAGVKYRAKAGQDYRKIIPAYLLGTVVRKVSTIPSVLRIGLVSANPYSNIAVSPDTGNGRYLLRDRNSVLYRGAKNDIIRVRYAPSYKKTVATITRAAGGTATVATAADYIRLIPQPATSTSSPDTKFRVKSTNRRYRGMIEFRYAASDNKLWAINQIAMEPYLKGIAEEPNEWPTQGLRVMAVGCRSYASYRAVNPKHSGSGFQLCDGPHCQFYVGYNREIYQPNVAAAVNYTKGQVVTYGGQVVIVPFFSTCGGKTENIEDVWGGTAKPYLKGVVCGWCNTSLRAKWSGRKTVKALEAELHSRSPMSVPGELINYRVLERGFSPRIKRMRLYGTSGIKDVWGVWFHEQLNWESSWFKLYMPSRIGSVNWTYKTLTPNGDGISDTSRLSWKHLASARSGLVITNSSGVVVKRWGPWASRPPGPMSLVWNGKGSDGKLLANGRYSFIIGAVTPQGCKNEFRGYIYIKR